MGRGSNLMRADHRGFNIKILGPKSDFIRHFPRHPRSIALDLFGPDYWLPNWSEGMVEFRFYEELNDHLPPVLRKRAFPVQLSGTPKVGELIAFLGVPLGEVDLLLVDGISRDFEHRLQGDERVAVYPIFERFDITPLVRLAGRPLDPRFRR
jgi:hypothetical protein